MIRDIILAANDEGQSFSMSMEKLKKYAYGIDAVQGPRLLRILSNAGCIVPNDYSVQAQISLKLAKQVSTFTL